MTASDGRRAFTLAELLVALVLLATIVTLVASTATTQWRADAALDARRGAHAQLVAAAQALAAALRTAAGDGAGEDSSDVVLVADTLLDVRVPTGASVVCGLVDASTLELPPPSTEPPALTWWTAMPAAGDVVRIDSASGAPSGAGDGWIVRTIADVTQATRGCVGAPFARASQATLPRIHVRTTAPLPASITAGALVRFARRTRYVHYRASDGRWYLGQREWNGATWTTTQPVAGPLRAPGTRGGLTLRAYDSLGVLPPTADLAAARVTAIEVALRADVPGLVRRAPWAIDSVALRVALRNGAVTP